MLQSEVASSYSIVGVLLRHTEEDKDGENYKKITLFSKLNKTKEKNS